MLRQGCSACVKSAGERGQGQAQGASGACHSVCSVRDAELVAKWSALDAVRQECCGGGGTRVQSAPSASAMRWLER